MNKHQLMWEALRKAFKEYSAAEDSTYLSFDIVIGVVLDAMDEIEIDHLTLDTKYILDHYETYKTQVQYYRKTGALPSMKIGSRRTYYLKDIKAWAKEKGIKEAKT